MTIKERLKYWKIKRNMRKYSISEIDAIDEYTLNLKLKNIIY